MAKNRPYPEFDAEKDRQRIVTFLRNWFINNGPTAKAVIGISGGKDSSIAAALCVEALGKDRVVGVLMPNEVQADIEDSLRLVNHLGIKYRIVNIGTPFKEMLNELQYSRIPNYNNFEFAITDALTQNLAPRLRMSVLYAIAQGLPEGGRVINTCNASEDYIGYSTKFGDSAGDVAPLASYTVTEVLAIGDIMNLPADLVHKIPSDGLCGKSDEENLGFAYSVLDKYIKIGECESDVIRANIDRRHELNKHKLETIPTVPR